MSRTHRIILVNVETGEVEGGVGVHPSGMLEIGFTRPQRTYGTFKALEKFIGSTRPGDEPLYRQYADRLDERRELPDEILAAEAERIAAEINACDPPYILSLPHLEVRVRAVVRQKKSQL